MQPDALLRVAQAVFTDDPERADELTLAIADPDMQAWALAQLAGNAEPGKARLLLARALIIGAWQESVNVLMHIDPRAVIAIADEYLRAESLNGKSPSPG